MLLLTSTTDKLQVVTGQAITVDVHASWVDNAAGTITPGRTNSAISTAATTDVVAAPGASTQRNVQTLVVRNKDVATSVDVTVKHTDGTTAVELFKLTLPAGYELQYLDGVGFAVFNTSGQVQGQGATGSTGATGTTLPSAVEGAQGDDGPPGPGFGSGTIMRAMLGFDAKNTSFLGTTGAGTGGTVGPLIWTGEFRNIYFEYIIGGYNGGTPVGRVLMGGASISTTALTNGNRLSENDVTNATSVSVPGCPTAVALSAIARSGYGFIRGASGSLKQMNISGLNGNPAVATSPADFHAKSFFSDLGTNLLIQRLQLTVYDTLIATAASAQTFTATTQLWAWGRNND